MNQQQVSPEVQQQILVTEAVAQQRDENANRNALLAAELTIARSAAQQLKAENEALKAEIAKFTPVLEQNPKQDRVIGEA